MKEAVFPFVKFPGEEVALTPEMKSTGEVMSIDEDPKIAYFKSQIAAGSPLPKGRLVFVALSDEAEALELMRAGKAKWVVCPTPAGTVASDRIARLRSGAVAAGVPLTTTLDGFRAAFRGGLAEEGSFGGTGVRTLQEYHVRR